MCSDKNPMEGKIATNLTEMVRISEKAREWEKQHTSSHLQWYDLQTGNPIATSF